MNSHLNERLQRLIQLTETSAKLIDEFVAALENSGAQGEDIQTLCSFLSALLTAAREDKRT